MAGQVEPGIAKGAGIIGILLLIMGVANAIAGIVFITYNGTGAHGLWSGGACIISGGLGILIMWKKSHVVMIFFLILNIIIVIVCGVQAFLVWVAYVLYKAFVSDQTDGRCMSTTADTCRCGPYGNYTYLNVSCDWFESIEAILLSIAILSALACIISLAGSIAGCIGACCARRQDPGVVVMNTNQPGVVYTAAAQPGYPQGGPPGYDQPPPKV